MKKFIALSAIMLFGMSVSIIAQTNESDYSLDGIDNTLSQYKFEYANDFHDGVAKIGVRQGEELLYGLINKKGEIILPFEYKKIEDYSENGLIAVADIHWKWGYADKKGNIVIPCQYNDTGSRGTGVFSEGLAAVYLDESTACYINEQGEIVIPPFTAYRAGEFHGGIAPIELEKKETSFINLKGETVVPPIKGRCRNFTEGLFLVDGNEGVWLMNSQGKIITPKQGWFLRGIFSEGLMGYGTFAERKYGFINTNGKIVIPARYDEVGAFCEGLAAVKINNKWGFVNKEGELVIPCQFDRADSFSEGLAAVCINNKWGFINKEGEIVIQCLFNSAQKFSNGYTVVTNDNKQPALMDKQTQVLIMFGEMPYISGYSDGLCRISTNDRVGYVDKEGHAILVPIVK